MDRISSYMISQRAVQAMLGQQRNLAETQLQLATGKRVINPSDDPASAARVLGLNQAIATVQQYQENANTAKERLELEESVLSSVTELLHRAGELAVQGNNDALSPSDKKTVGMEVRQLLDQMVSMANTKNSSGEYVFVGYQTHTKPFSLEASGLYEYNGDMGQRKIQIAPDRQVADGDNGFDVFVDVKTSPMASVKGIAATDLTAIIDGDITIDGGNGAGPVSLGDIPGATTAEERALQMRDAVNRVSEDTGVSARVDGAELILSTTEGAISIAQGPGVPAMTGLTSGTTDAVSGKQSIFDTFDQLATKLESDDSVGRYISDLQLALDNILESRGKVGARLNAIDRQLDVNADLELNLETRRSEEQDLDYMEAIARFERQKLALEAAQKTFVQVKDLSLFNYI